MSCPKHEIQLTEREMRLLDFFRTEPFMPVVRRISLDTPYLILAGEDYSDSLMWLQLKGLVDIELSAPVEGGDYSVYPESAVRGSASLTARGQEALDSLDILGAQ
ncbi:MAG: hypothetical protein IJP43_04480 [Oscillospiraceae bacterium]|nr:hypothetical protein [Oscillospiraceae bacterium]